MEHLGLNSKHFRTDTLEENKDNIEFIKKNFHTYDFDKCDKQLKGVLLNGKVQTNYIFDYYFMEIASDTKMYKAKISINEHLKDDLCINYHLSKIAQGNEKVFGGDLLKDYKTAIRTISDVCNKPTNFPLKEALRLLEPYNGTYVDLCCGWGVRMIASAILGLEYVGFDINEPLCDKLEELGKHIQKYKPNFKFTIIRKSNATKIEGLKADIMLTSPPYFNLEEYNHYENGNKPSNNYEEWLETFVEPMIHNAFEIAKPNTKIMFNVKSFKNYPLEEDFYKILNKYTNEIEFDVLKHSKRVKSNRSGMHKGEEVVLIATKH